MTGSYVSDAQYRQNALFIGVLRPKRSFFLIFMIIHKYLYI